MCEEIGNIKQEEIKKSYKEQMSLLTKEEKIIFESVISELSDKLRREVYMTGDTNLFMKTIKSIRKVESENKSTGEIKTISSKSIEKSFKKFKQMGLIKNGLFWLAGIFP